MVARFSFFSVLCILQISYVYGGQCLFRQNCVHDDLDGPCTSTASNHTSFNLKETYKNITAGLDLYWDGYKCNNLDDCGDKGKGYKECSNGK